MAIPLLARSARLAATPIFLLTAHAFREARDRGFASRLHGTSDEAHQEGRSHRSHQQVCSRRSIEFKFRWRSWLKPVVGGYLEKRRGDVAKLRAALDRGDYATIRTLGHQMAGTGGGYGFEPITEIGSALEESALAGDAARVRASIEDLDRYLNAVQVE